MQTLIERISTVENCTIMEKILGGSAIVLSGGLFSRFGQDKGVWSNFIWKVLEPPAGKMKNSV